MTIHRPSCHSRHPLWTIHRQRFVNLQAIEAGQGSKDDWAEFKYRHRQAEQDSHLLYSVLQQAEQFHQVCCCYLTQNRNMFDTCFTTANFVVFMLLLHGMQREYVGFVLHSSKVWRVTIWVNFYLFYLNHGFASLYVNNSKKNTNNVMPIDNRVMQKEECTVLMSLGISHWEAWTTALHMPWLSEINPLVHAKDKKLGIYNSSATHINTLFCCSRAAKASRAMSKG